MGVICLQGHAQAELIQQMLFEAVGPAPFENRRLICGDPYSFQGDERHVVFLSMVVASEGGRTGALTKESYRQRFNVAVSRAMDQVWVFHSITEQELHPECMRRRLLEFCYHPQDQVLSQDLSRCDSDFERDVAKALMARNYRVIPQYPAAGKKIDLVVEGTKTRLAVECDGDDWHGPDRYEADMTRQRMLERCGWKFVRVRGSSFYANRQREIARIVDELKTQGIEPVGQGESAADDRQWISEVSGNECSEQVRCRGRATAENGSAGVDRHVGEHGRGGAATAATTENSGGPATPTSPERQSWQMTLATWKKRREELQERGDIEGLRAIGGLGADHAHRYRLQEALAQGKPVPPQVLRDYPDLCASGGDQ
jgi:very-short-patch-repair endonuclease